MRTLPDALRVQVCTRCNIHGNYPVPDNPGTSRTCQHPEVVRYDVRTGKWTHTTR
jgi:hypothetical protein